MVPVLSLTQESEDFLNEYKSPVVTCFVYNKPKVRSVHNS
jgi:hypothetical protein